MIFGNQNKLGILVDPTKIRKQVGKTGFFLKKYVQVTIKKKRDNIRLFLFLLLQSQK